jgi:hypothetical protein
MTNNTSRPGIQNAHTRLNPMRASGTGAHRGSRLNFGRTV